MSQVTLDSFGNRPFDALRFPKVALSVIWYAKVCAGLHIADYKIFSISNLTLAIKLHDQHHGANVCVESRCKRPQRKNCVLDTRNGTGLPRTS